MSSPEHQEKLKAEAKAVRDRLATLIKEKDAKTRMVRTACIYAGMMTETLIEYEEPDVVMEQAFHRVAELLQADPAEGEDEKGLLPLATDIDHDTELGRHLARNIAQNLPKALDDVHEIAIALIISDFPVWEAQGYPRGEMLRLLIETVISALTFEMATQDFCDLLIEDFLAEDDRTVGDGILALGAAAGYFFAIAQEKMDLPEAIREDFTNVMVRESLRHGTPGAKNWKPLAVANDDEFQNVPAYIEALKTEIEAFFALIGLENPLGQAVAVAKAAGRIVAVIIVEDVGQIHPSIAKSLAKTGMILGVKYKGEDVIKS